MDLEKQKVEKKWVVEIELDSKIFIGVIKSVKMLTNIMNLTWELTIEYLCY